MSELFIKERITHCYRINSFQYQHFTVTCSGEEDAVRTDCDKTGTAFCRPDTN